MKYLLLAAGLFLAGCTKPALTDRQQARRLVMTAIKDTISSPGSYEPGVFLAATLTRADSAHIEASKLHEQLFVNTKALAAMSPSGISASQQLLNKNQKLLDQASKLNSIQDTTRVGWYITHSYKAKNKQNLLTPYKHDFAVYLPKIVVLVR